MTTEQWDDSGWYKPTGDYDPLDPATWSPQERVSLLTRIGFQWVAGNSGSAVWRAPSGEVMSESAALNTIARGSVPQTAPQVAPDRSLQIGINPATGKPEMFGVGANGLPVWTGVSPVPSTSSSQGFAPQYGSYTEETTGDRVFTTNGQVTSRIPGATWASLTPQQQFQQESSLRKQMDDAAMAREQAGNAAAMDRAQLTEGGINSRFGVSSQEAATMDRATLAERARAANLSAATDAFGNVVRVAPQLGQLALSNAEFTKDTLRNAPDYLARAFFQQGQTSPLPQVSQADIINQLRSNIQGFNTTLQGFNPQVGAYQAPAAYNPMAGFGGGAAGAPRPGLPTALPKPPLLPPPPVAPLGSAAWHPPVNGQPGFSTIEAQNPAGSYSEDWTPAELGSVTMPDGSQSSANTQSADAGDRGTAVWDPEGSGGIVYMAGGGFTRAPQMIVGDSVSGRPTGHEEIVSNPTGAPITVQPVNPQGMAAQAAPDPVAAKHKTMHDSIAKVIGFVQDPALQHALVDEMRQHQEKPASPEVPRFATGTDLMGFSIPQLPTPGLADQASISALEKSVRPPAINQLLGGQTPGEMQFGFNLFTPNQLNSLSREGREALGTTLATQYNETVPNVEDAIKRRWSTGNRRTAGAVGF